MVPSGFAYDFVFEISYVSYSVYAGAKAQDKRLCPSSSRTIFCSDVRQLALNRLCSNSRRFCSSLLESYLCYCYLAQNVFVCIRISFFECNVFLYRVGNFSKMSWSAVIPLVFMEVQSSHTQFAFPLSLWRSKDTTDQKVGLHERGLPMWRTNLSFGVTRGRLNF